MRIFLIFVFVTLSLVFHNRMRGYEEQLKHIKLENTELKLKLQEDKCYCTKLKFCDTLTDKEAENGLKRHNNR